MWNLEGSFITGLYLDEFQVTGRVRVSRVKYGGGISHHIDLIKPMEIYGSIRDSVIINHCDVKTIHDNI